MVFGTALTATSQAVLSEDVINGLDSRISRDTWDKLPRVSEIYDPHIWLLSPVHGTAWLSKHSNVVTEGLLVRHRLFKQWHALP